MSPRDTPEILSTTFGKAISVHAYGLSDDFTCTRNPGRPNAAPALMTSSAIAPVVNLKANPRLSAWRPCPRVDRLLDDFEAARARPAYGECASSGTHLSAISPGDTKRRVLICGHRSRNIQCFIDQDGLREAEVLFISSGGTRADARQRRLRSRSQALNTRQSPAPRTQNLRATRCRSDSGFQWLRRVRSARSSFANRAAEPTEPASAVPESGLESDHICATVYFAVSLQ